MAKKKTALRVRLGSKEKRSDTSIARHVVGEREVHRPRRAAGAADDQPPAKPPAGDLQPAGTERLPTQQGEREPRA